MSEKEKLDLETTDEATLEATETVAESSATEKPAKSDKAKKAKAPEKKKSGRVSRYLREMRSELKKVAWPTKSQTINNTGIVILCVIVVGACVWIFDALAGELISGLLKLFGNLFG